MNSNPNVGTYYSIIWGTLLKLFKLQVCSLGLSLNRIKITVKIRQINTYKAFLNIFCT